MFTLLINIFYFKVDVANLLTVGQLSQLAAIPSQLTSQEDVAKVMTAINPAEFGAFFDAVSPAIEVRIFYKSIVFLSKPSQKTFKISCYIGKSMLICCCVFEAQIQK